MKPRTAAAIAVSLLVGLSSIALGGSEGAEAAAPLDYDFAVLPGSSLAGANTSLVWSTSGAWNTYHDSLTLEFPIGMEFAHADSIPGVSPSPVDQRPHDGDIVGEHEWTSEFGPCGAVSTRRYVFVWNEPFRFGSEPGKVAELTIRLLPDLDLMALSFYEGTDGATGLPRYTATTRTGGGGLMCPGANFREVGQFYSSPSVHFARNAQVAGSATTCVSAVDVFGGAHRPCATAELIDPLSQSAEVPCTITGTIGPDVLVGTSGDDIICGLGGNDRINGLAGNDVVIGGDGDDRLVGGTGDDTIVAGLGADVIIASFGDDVVSGGDGTDKITGASGDDVLMGDDGNDVLDGGGGNDALGGGTGDDSLIGGGNSNLLDGGSGADTCRAGSVRSLSVAIGCE